MNIWKGYGAANWVIPTAGALKENLINADHAAEKYGLAVRGGGKYIKYFTASERGRERVRERERPGCWICVCVCVCCTFHFAAEERDKIDALCLWSFFCLFGHMSSFSSRLVFPRTLVTLFIPAAILLCFVLQLNIFVNRRRIIICDIKQNRIQFFSKKKK